LEGLANAVAIAGYSWHAGQVPLGSLPGRLTYLLGYPNGHKNTHCLNPQTRGFELGSNSIVPNPFPCDKERVEFPICLRHEIETSLPFGLLYSPLLSPVAGARGVSRRYCRARGDAGPVAACLRRRRPIQS